MERARALHLALIGGMLCCMPASAEPTDEAVHAVQTAIRAVCPRPTLSGFDVQLALPGSWVIDERHGPDSTGPRRSRVHLALPQGTLLLERREANGTLQQFRATYHLGTQPPYQPHMLAITDATCTIRSARAIREVSAAERTLDELDETLTSVRWSETLQAPWPDGEDPGGPRVALVDTGLAYDLPHFRNALARDADGRPLGYDHWDQDPWPYDGDTVRGPFFPIRHGSAVASVLVAEAPHVALIPLRFPRPDMSRMAAVVERAAAAGARVIAMPLGSNRRKDWTAFANALKAHDLLAIVSAGNDGRNIDEVPVYPAAFTDENIITVTSADPFGQLADGSNWGEASVDIMLPAENLPVVDFRGAAGVASGSSYAVPRLAALAARILTKAPHLSPQALKAALFARATKPVFERGGVVAVGWIADPTAD